MEQEKFVDNMNKYKYKVMTVLDTIADEKYAEFGFDTCDSDQKEEILRCYTQLLLSVNKQQ